jgi:hypothetical protein
MYSEIMIDQRNPRRMRRGKRKNGVSPKLFMVLRWKDYVVLANPAVRSVRYHHGGAPSGSSIDVLYT